jgi:type IV secretion system protein TrbG
MAFLGKHFLHLSTPVPVAPFVVIPSLSLLFFFGVMGSQLQAGANELPASGGGSSVSVSNVSGSSGGGNSVNIAPLQVSLGQPDPSGPSAQAAVPVSQPVVPVSQIAVPVTQPAIPATQQAAQVTQQAVQVSQPAIPVSQPAVPVKAAKARRLDPPADEAAYDYSAPPSVTLTSQDKQALALTQSWKRDSVKPYMVEGGKITYMHGASVPTIITSPLQACDVELEPGELINEIVVGDPRWSVENGSSGTTPHLFIKAVDSGLESSAIITTDRRVYHLRLVSQRNGHTPYVGFVYQASIQRKAQAQAETAAKQKEWSSTKDATGKPVDLSQLNFHYDLSGDSPSWKPERVYDDGTKTYVQLPGKTRSGEMPVLHIRKGGESILVNYRVQDTTMMIDGVFNTIALVAGVGSDQETVEIRRQK